jgi:pyruvate dehydrogenase E2 component (dihydrolipoamide acetyltransferase)
MASDVTMPRLSDSMEEGTVLKWLVDEGGEVKRGEPLVEIETDKANMTYDADTDGVLVEIVAQEGDTLEIGEVIARIGDAGEAKSGGEAEEGDEEEAGGDAAESEGGEEEAGGDEAEESEGGEEETGGDEGEEDEGAEDEGDEDEAGDEEKAGAVAEGDEDEAGDEEKAGAVAEGEGDDAEGGGEEGAGDEEAEDGAEGGDADAEGGEEDDSAAAEGGDGADAGEDQDEEAAAEGEEAAVAGAEGGGGETQAGAGTATREKTSTGNGDGRVKASPVARRMARDLGVELAELEGTGPGGRIVKADVQAAAENGGGKAGVAEKGQAEPAEGDGDGAEAAKKDKKGKKKDKKADDGAEKKDGAKAEKDGKAAKEDGKDEKAEAGVKGHVKVEELTRLQQTVSRRMAESKATAPDFSIALSVDMTAAVALRERLKEISDPVPSFNDMVVKACAGALREHPRVNGSYRDGKFELYDRVNIGIAVAAMDALVVPTVFDADQKSLGQIARDAREVIGKVKDKTVTPPELSGGTFTVSNLGMFGIEQFTAIINPPQAAILTVGKLEKRPAVDDKGKLIARDQMVLTLVCDHRILYGADGAEFLARVKDLLEQPLSLAL